MSIMHKHSCHACCACKWLKILCADLIFVTNIISGEKIVMWRNFSFPCMTIMGKLKISPHDNCGEIWNSPHLAFLQFFIHAVLSRYLFCRNLALSCGEKLSPKVHLWRKNDKYQVWAHLVHPPLLDHLLTEYEIYNMSIICMIQNCMNKLARDLINMFKNINKVGIRFDRTNALRHFFKKKRHLTQFFLFCRD